MPEALSFLFGPKSWSLVNADGSLKKTAKANLSTHLEKQGAFVTEPSDVKATVIDAMGIVQKLQGKNITLGELSKRILSCILNSSRNCQHIDVIFDIYMKNLTQSAERISQGSKEGILFHNTKSDYRIKNYKCLFSNVHSKNRRTKFLAEAGWK